MYAYKYVRQLPTYLPLLVGVEHWSSESISDALIVDSASSPPEAALMVLVICLMILGERWRCSRSKNADSVLLYEERSSSRCLTKQWPMTPSEYLRRQEVGRRRRRRRRWRVSKAGG